MFCKYVSFFLVFFTGVFLLAAENSITVWDSSGGNMYLQEFLSRALGNESSAVPQDVSINIADMPAGEIKDIPPDTVIADDGMFENLKIEKYEKTVYAYQPAVLAVSLDNPLDDIDITEIKRIFSGRAGDWERIGGKSGKIKLAGYPEKSAIGRVFRKKAMMQDLQNNGNNNIANTIAPDMIVCRTSNAAEALLQTSGNFIVFGGAVLLKNAKGKYKILKINGVYPSYKNIREGKYKLYTEHSIISNKTNPSATLKELLDFLKKSVTCDIIPVK